MKTQTRLLDRLTERARALAPKPSRVLYAKDGVEKTGSIDEMLADSGAFLRFVDDSASLREVDRILALWDDAADIINKSR